MADNVVVAAWRRFLAAPLESRGKTLLVAIAVSSACALVVTGATVMLRPIQAANRAAEQQMRLEALLAAIPGMSEILSENADAALSAVVIDLETGRAATDVTPEELGTAMESPDNWTALSPEEDVAMIGSRPDIAQVFLLRDGAGIRLAILPVFGAGYNGPIQAMLALHGDMETIAGIAVTDHSETPGLGARIEEEAWQASFAGKRYADESGAMRFSVARGPSASDYEVDGITGATRTSNAITRIVRFWMGPDGFGPFLDAVRRNEF
jgi:Na+-transporting NADH:ubiquinone oxidoreductase subunit C